jgi:hypothetical protein
MVSYIFFLLNIPHYILLANSENQNYSNGNARERVEGFVLFLFFFGEHIQ